jgi:hypothetical protein
VAASCNEGAWAEPVPRTAGSEPEELPVAGAAGVVQLILADDEGADVGTEDIGIDDVATDEVGTDDGTGSTDSPVSRSRRQSTQPPSGPMARPCLVHRPRFMPSNRTA